MLTYILLGIIIVLLIAAIILLINNKPEKDRSIALLD